MDSSTPEIVRRRAGYRCEYCLVPQSAFPRAAFHIEHIIAKQHGGRDDLSNLALACGRCNLHKGPNLTGIDPLSGNIALLFHPRRDDWRLHFKLESGSIGGLTETGRATAHLLTMNAPDRIAIRLELQILPT
jgi:hypothetical protein